MNITAITIVSEKFVPISKITSPNKLAYCQRHGYDFRVFGHIFPGRHPAWSKIAAAELMIYSNNCPDFIWFTDADSIVTNPAYTLESIIAIDRSADLWLCRDERGINTGQMIMRTSQKMQLMLRAIWDINDQCERPECYEEGALEHLLNHSNGKGVCYVPKNRLNSYYEDWKDGDFIFHAHDVNADHRASALQFFSRWMIAGQGISAEKRCDMERSYRTSRTIVSDPSEGVPVLDSK